MDNYANVSVPFEVFILTVKAHEIVSGTGANVLYNHKTGMSTWMVGTTPVGLTRGSVSGILGGGINKDSYLFVQTDTGYYERVETVAKQLGERHG